MAMEDGQERAAPAAENGHEEGKPGENGVASKNSPHHEEGHKQREKRSGKKGDHHGDPFYKKLVILS